MYLYPHNDKWKAEFLYEKKLINTCSDTFIDVLHIGSTAIQGLYAKNCIDVLAMVNDIADIDDLKQGLVKLGYNYKGEYGIVGRQYFSKEHRKVHLHIFQKGDENIEKHLDFVAKMQNNAVLVAELNKLKIELHEAFPNDKTAYQAGKAHFYEGLKK